MTPGDDDDFDMFSRSEADAALLDAVLADQPVGSHDGAFARALVDIIAVGHAPAPAPSPALAAFLRGDASIAPEPGIVRTWHISSLLGRLAGLSAAAKASLVTVAAGAAVAATGGAHSLPGPAQRLFEDVVNNATPFTISDDHAGPQAPAGPPISGVPGSVSTPSRPSGIGSSSARPSPDRPAPSTSPRSSSRPSTPAPPIPPTSSRPVPSSTRPLPPPHPSPTPTPTPRSSSRPAPPPHIP